MSFFNLLDKAKKNQKGFTLIELIVTLAIFSIILVVAGNYLFFGNNLFVKTEVKNSEKYIGDNVFEYMQRRLTYATHVEVINPDKSKDPKYTNGIKLNSDGQLLMGPFEVKDEDGKIKSGLTNVFSPEFYGNGYKVSYEVKVVDATHMELKVNVLAQGNDSPVYTTSEVLEILNLQANARDSGSILITNGERNAIYTNPVISYEEDKKVSTTYDPLVLKDQMMDVFNKIVKGEILKDRFEITGLNNQFASNDYISAYVTQYYYKGKPYIGSWAKEDVYPYWPDFPGFDQDTIKNVDAKVIDFTNYAGEVGKGNGKDQTLSNYLYKYKSTMKMRGYIYPENGKKTSCFIYVCNDKDGGKWGTRLIYCDETTEKTEVGWYYLVSNKAKGVEGNIGDKFTVNNRVWKATDELKSPNRPIYDVITSTEEGTWIKVE